MTQLKTLNKYIFRYKWHFILGVLFVAASNYFKVLIPKAVREAIDLVIEALSIHDLYQGTQTAEMWQDSIGRSLLYYGLMVLGAALITGVFMFFMRQTIIVMSRLIEYDLRDDIFKHYTTFDQAFLRRNSTGDLMSRISEDVSKVRMYLGPGLLYAINLVTLFILVIYTMFQVNVRLTIYTLLPLPILSVIIYYISDLINRKSYLIQQQLAKLTSIAQEVYSGIRVVKSYVQEDAMSSYFSSEAIRYKEKSLDLARVNAFFFPTMVFFIGISTIITIYVGGILVMQGEVSPGNLAEFVIYVNMLTWPVTAIGWIASIVQQAEASQLRINEFMHYDTPIASTNGYSPETILGKITFDNVSFTYPDSGIEALKHVSFTVESGTSLAIVGRTASGKSTIADLIFRLFDASSGQILIDDRPIQEYNLRQLRRSMSYVPQDVFLFSNSINENIRFGDASISDEKIVEMAKLSAVHDDIIEFADGYRTVIGERGVSLSGGQKQRISLARALIEQPAILVMDDALSAVDADTEFQIIGHLERIMSGRTTIFVTHRLNALTLFDQIIVLDDGEIVERGSHDSLLLQNGLYAELFRQQQLAIPD